MITAFLWVENPYGEWSPYVELGLPRPMPLWRVAMRDAPATSWLSRGLLVDLAGPQLKVMDFVRVQKLAHYGPFDYVWKWGTFS